MKISILGSGCRKCNQLEENVRKAIAETGITAEVEKITDLDKIMDHGVMMTPALMIDEEVKSMGKVLSSTDVARLIK